MAAGRWGYTPATQPCWNVGLNKMSTQNKSPYDDTLCEPDNAMDMDRTQQGSEEHTPVLRGTEGMVEVEMEAGAPPGPSSSKARYRTRSRGGSVSRSTSRARTASAELTAERKSRREAAQNANRFDVLANHDDGAEGDSQQVPIILDSDESEEGSMRAEPKKHPPKRKKVKAERDEERSSSEETQRKRGRPPQTTAHYVGRADAVEKLNKANRVALDLEIEKRVSELSASEIRATHKSSVQDKLEELEYAPTEDVAQRVMESMVEVWKVATISKNLKGGFVKALKQAAAMGTASAEVLSQRAGSKETDSDTLKQVKVLRRELELTKKEVQAAREREARMEEKMKELHKELEDTRRKEENRRKVRAAFEDSPPPSPFDPGATGKERPEGTREISVATEMEVDDPTPNPEVAEVGAPAPMGGDPPEYSDERRRAEILPPPEQWPTAYRPPLQGKSKILEDGILTGTRVRMVKDKRKPPTSAPTPASDGRPKSIDPQSLMEALAPKMMEWLKASLSAFGLTESTNRSENKDARADNKDRKKGQKSKAAIPATSRTQNPAPQTKGGGRGGLTPTTVPNQKLWSVAVGGKQGGSTPPTQTERKDGVIQPTAVPGSEAWVEVKNRKRGTKKTPTAEAKPPAGKGPRNAAKAAGQGRTGEATGKPVPPKKDGAKKNQAPLAGKPPRRRPPRTAAVTLTCPPGEYARVMQVAREKINLRDIGIEALRPRRAATGAIVLEVPGPNGPEKATALRDKMEEALRDIEGVKVAKPVKMGELRINRILDSTTVDEIREAISRIGGCSAEEVRTGDIKPAPNGLGTLWAQCPLAAANKVVSTGKIGIGQGWSTLTVQALEPRLLRCYKCLEPGHVQASCPSADNRRSLCYRCSREGHVAKNCEFNPHCAICEGAGRPSAHKMGGRACKAPARKAGLPRGVRPQSSECMEVDGEDGAPATQAGSVPSKGPPASAQQRVGGKTRRPAVRGGPDHVKDDRAPVPVRSAQEDEMMEVEVVPYPATAPPSLGSDIPEGEKDGGTSGTPTCPPL